MLKDFRMLLKPFSTFLWLDGSSGYDPWICNFFRRTAEMLVIEAIFESSKTRRWVKVNWRDKKCLNPKKLKRNYQERFRRYITAMNGGTPDRIPIRFLLPGSSGHRYAGLTTNK
jgi:hypothetical protein